MLCCGACFSCELATCRRVKRGMGLRERWMGRKDWTAEVVVDHMSIVSDAWVRRPQRHVADTDVLQKFRDLYDILNL